MSTIQAVPVDPANPQNVTSFHRNEIGWSARTPAASLGRLDPPRNWHLLQRVPNMKDSVTGNDILDSKGVPILDYPDLPRYLSSNLEWFRVEAYFRLHPDMSYYQLWQRQPLGTPVPTTKQRNMMNNMRLRKARLPYKARCWTKKGLYPPRNLVELVEGLSQTQLLLNTTWIVTPRAIIQPGTNRRLPLNIYLDGYPAHTPSVEVRAALAESHRLQALARSHHVAHWSELPRDLLPHAWFGRARAKQPQGAQTAGSSRVDTTESKESSEQNEDNDNVGMEGEDEEKETDSGSSGTDSSSEEEIQSLAQDNSEADAKGEENEYSEEAMHEEEDEEEEGSQDNSGPQANTPLWGFQDVMGVATIDDMHGGQLFQNETSLDMIGMGGPSGAVYNGLQEDEGHDAFWQPIPTMESFNDQQIPWIHRPADTPAGGSCGYVIESNAPQAQGPLNSSLLGTSHNFRGTLDMGSLDRMLYETPADGEFYPQFVNNIDGQL